MTGIRLHMSTQIEKLGDNKNKKVHTSFNMSYTAK